MSSQALQRDPFPRETDSIAVTAHRVKTAALLFDRVVSFPPTACPAPVAFDPFVPADDSPDTPGVEIRLTIDGPVISVETQDIGSHDRERPYSGKDVAGALQSAMDPVLRVAADEIRTKLGLRAFPVYSTHRSYEAEYKRGDYGVLVATLANLEIVKEERLVWDQIIEFRADHDARTKYRRMIHWLDEKMLGKSQSFVQDDLEYRLADYRRVLKKHGMDSAFGSLTAVIDEKVLAAGATMVGALSYLQIDPVIAALSSGGILLSNVVAKLAKNACDYRAAKEEKGKEIAYVLEMKRQLG